MQVQDAPFRRQDMTLEQIKYDPRFSHDWYVKETDGRGFFVVPLPMYFQNISEHDPILFTRRTAFFNESETVVLLVQIWRDDREAITFLHQTAALDYMRSKDIY